MGDLVADGRCEGGVHQTDADAAAGDGHRMPSEAGALGKHAIFVDVDGTLCRSDTFFDSLCHLARHAPWAVITVFLVALRRGRAAAKSWLAQRAMCEAAHLPYRDEVLAWLHRRRAEGHPVALATGCDRRVARRIAAHLWPGHDVPVLASDGRTNLTGVRKLAAIEELCTHRGWDDFAYLGDSHADAAVWRGCDRPGAVARRPGLLRRLARSGIHFDPVFGHESWMRRVAAGLRAVRLHQWSKNLLVLTAPLLAHLVPTADEILALAAAVLAMGMASSSVYLINDIVDLGHDRRKPSRRRRVLVAGEMGVPSAVALALGLTIGAVVLAAWCAPAALALIGLYLVLAHVYSFALKRRPWLDVICLAGFYLIRIYLGSIAVWPRAPVSDWLAVFAFFFFLSLSLVKRYAEVRASAPAASGGDGTGVVGGRGYRGDEQQLLLTAGFGCGLLSCLILGIYCHDTVAMRHYAEPRVLLAMVALLFYWLARLWTLAVRGLVHDDPVLFVLKDGRSPLFVLVGAAIMLLASFGWPW